MHDTDLKKMRAKFRYTADDKMSDLVEWDYRILLVISRFGIGPGFGDKSIREVCRANGVDLDTFLVVVRATVEGGDEIDYDTSNVSPRALLDYLTHTHDYYWEYSLPAIRRELIEAWDSAETDLLRATIDYYDEFVGDLRRHTGCEEKVLFPYVSSLAEGHTQSPPDIDGLTDKHDLIMARLEELKRILIKYYPARDMNRMNRVLFYIYNCECDMSLHRKLEEMLLARVIADLERKIEMEVVV